MLPRSSLAKVDFPVPEGPMTPTETPGGIDKEMDDKTGSVAPG